MFFLSKLIWTIINPIALVFISGVVSLAAAWIWKKRWGKWGALASLSFLWFVATPVGSFSFGLPLENPWWPEISAEAYPQADAILLLGGGMAINDGDVYPNMNESSDRVWHAARLYKAGRAPIILTSGGNDRASTWSLLRDLGVPESALRSEDASRNTKENVSNSAALLSRLTGKDNPKVLLVTSAWHMNRAILNAKIGGLDAIPAPCDYICHSSWNDNPIVIRNWFLPDGKSIYESCIFAKEWVGIIEKKLFGKGG